MAGQNVNETPKVSVVCAWYNRADYIRDTIESLLEQDLVSFEVVVINDGSTDPRVREILETYDDPRLRVVHQQNTGFTVAIKRAIEMTTAPFVAIQGAGDVSLPERLRLQWEAMQHNPEISIVGCGYRVCDLVRNTRRDATPKAPTRGQYKGFEFSHGELMYRRQVYDHAGGYRNLFVVGQGSDLWMRMLRKSTAIVLPAILYEQRLFSDGVSKDYRKLTIRSILAAVRKENERVFRVTGIDYINEYGVSAMSILASRPRVRFEIALSRSKIMLDADSRSIPLFDAGLILNLLSYGLLGSRQLKRRLFAPADVPAAKWKTP